MYIHSSEEGDDDKKSVRGGNYENFHLLANSSIKRIRFRLILAKDLLKGVI